MTRTTRLTSVTHTAAKRPTSSVTISMMTSSSFARQLHVEPLAVRAEQDRHAAADRVVEMRVVPDRAAESRLVQGRGAEIRAAWDCVAADRVVRERAELRAVPDRAESRVVQDHAVEIRAV